MTKSEKKRGNRWWVAGTPDGRQAVAVRLDQIAALQCDGGAAKLILVNGQAITIREDVLRARDLISKLSEG